jgi:hypothetical protein
MKAQPLFIALHLLSKAEGQRYEYPESPVHCSETDSCTRLCRVSLCTTDCELEKRAKYGATIFPLLESSLHSKDMEKRPIPKMKGTV